MSLVYVDSSAAVKRLVEEPESDAFERFMRQHLDAGHVLVTSALLALELHRLAFREGISQLEVQTVVRNFSTVAISRQVLELAAGIRHQIKALDAIHLGTALALREEDAPDSGVEQVITYDRSMMRTAARLGFEVVSPAAG